MHNIIKLEPYVFQYESKTQKNNEYLAYTIRFRLFIDNIEKYPDLDVDIGSIIRMLDPDYDYGHNFWNCDCGEPGCSNISDTTLVYLKDDTLLFKMRNPIKTTAFRYTISPDFTNDYSYWKNHAKIETIKINRTQLKAELLQLAEKIKYLQKTTNAFLVGYTAGYHFHDELTNVPDIFMLIEKNIYFYDKYI